MPVLELGDGPIDEQIVLPPDVRPPARRGLRVQRRALDRSEIEIVFGLPTTTPSGTVADLLRTEDRLRALWTADTAVRRADVSAADVATALGALPGSRRARGLLALALALADPASESPLETAQRLLFSDFSISGFTSQFCVRDVCDRLVARLDFADPVHKIGWLILRFTWRDILHRPSWVAATIQAAVQARR